ncbi:MAG TPA: AsmA-like C-terminal region-containing protein [Opitutaceae bacterium]|nr:AsmA-like C-terminal region-containing protein [Opitutaceae bacterium]
MNQSRPWLRVCRRCAHNFGSACLTTVCWFVWVALVALFVLLAVIAVRRELTVPEFLLHRLEQKLEFQHLSARFGRTAFDPQGNLVLEDVRLYGSGIQEPLARASSVRLRLDVFAVARGDFDVSKVEITGARFDCPAIVSPSGVSEPLISELGGTLRHENGEWSVPDATFFAGRVFVTASVTWNAPRAATAAKPTPANVLKEYIAAARKIAEGLRPTEQLEGARVHLSITGEPNTPPRLQAEIAVDRATLPAGADRPPIVVEELQARVDTAWRQSGLDPLSLRATAGQVAAPYGVVVQHPALRTSGHLSFQPLRWAGGPVELTAAAVRRADDVAEHPRVTVRFDSFSHFQAEIATLARGTSPVALQLEVDTAQRSGTVEIEAALAPALLNEAAARAAVWRKSRILAQLAFSEPAELRGRVELAPGWKLREARANAHLGAGVAYGTEMLATDAEVVVDPQRLLVEPLVFRRRDAEVHGSYGMDFRTQDYRFLLNGHFFPSAIDSWFSGWWTKLWDDFQFGARPPDADLDILGRWRSPERSIVYGWADIAPVTLRGVPLDRLRATLFIRPEHYDIISFDARRGALAATGGFTRHDDSATKKPLWINFDFHSTLPLAEGAKLFGPEGERTVEPFVFEQTPDVRASGRMEWGDAGLRQNITAAAAAPGVFRFHQFPVENAKLSFDLVDREIRVHGIQAELAGGALVGSATVDGPEEDRRLAFTGTLQGANLSRLVQTWMDYRALTAPPGTPPLPDSAKRLGEAGRVNLALDATGPIANLYALQGSGAVTVHGAQLAEIEMFGALSRALRGTLFGFTSLQFSDANAKFVLNGEHLDFTSLRLTGAMAAIRGKGRYTMPDSGLNFDVMLYPFRESNFPVFSVVGTILTPLTHMLEIRLSGTLAKPEWSLAVGAESLPTGQTAPPAAPAPPPAAGGETPVAPPAH